VIQCLSSGLDSTRGGSVATEAAYASIRLEEPAISSAPQACGWGFHHPLLWPWTTGSARTAEASDGILEIVGVDASFQHFLDHRQEVCQRANCTQWRRIGPANQAAGGRQHERVFAETAKISLAQRRRTGEETLPAEDATSPCDETLGFRHRLAARCDENSSFWPKRECSAAPAVSACSEIHPDPPQYRPCSCSVKGPDRSPNTCKPLNYLTVTS